MKLLSRASGYDFANLWMNMTKLVIALVFLYQNALDTQLGVRLFEDYFYVFHVPVRSESAGSTVTEVVTPEDPYFSIDFKPLALGQAYDTLAVEVLSLSSSRGEEILAPRPDGPERCSRQDPACILFSWADLTRGNKAVLHRASFDLLALAGDQSALVSGDYQVRFGFRFSRGGRLLEQRGQSGEYPGTVRFLRKAELRFGDVPVVQGRRFPMPRLIADRLRKGGVWGGWDAYRRVAVLEEGGGSSWKQGRILKLDSKRNLLLPVRRLAPGHTYEQRGHFFDNDRVQADFTIGFHLLKNEPPRSTYLGPGESDIRFVRIFYEWHFFEEDQGYYYYNLSRHIIDPDGVSALVGGRPDVRVARFSDLRPASLPYRLQRDRLTGDWHLRVLGRIEDSLAVGASHNLTVLASDDFQSQRIRIRIER